MLMFSRYNVLTFMNQHQTQSKAEAGISLVLQVFGHKPHYWTHLNFDLMMALDENFTSDGQMKPYEALGLSFCLCRK